jgi:hypothetical protein
MPPPVEHGHASVLHLPSPLASLRHSLPALLEGVAGPFAFFYLFLLLVGFRGALLACLGWTYLVLCRRLLRRERPPTVVILGSALLTVRTAIAFVTGSAFAYFVQPTAGTAFVALILLVSALFRRPFVERLAYDFCPLDPRVMSRPLVRRFFIQISMLWAAVLLANAGVVLWLLVTSSLRAFVVERTMVSWTLTVAAIVVSTLWFLRTMRRSGIAVRWGALAHAPANGGQGGGA